MGSSGEAARAGETVRSQVTPREWDVVSHVVTGASNKAVAARLHVSPKTVDFHLGRAFRKLGVSTRAELAYRVLGLGGGLRSSTTVNWQAGNLPPSLPQLFGRQTSVDQLLNAVAIHRLVSIVGPAGVGKTAVAVSVAHLAASSIPDGCWFVDLSVVETSEQVPAAATRSLGLMTTSLAPTAASVAQAVGLQNRLLVIDNCEHVLSGARALIAALLAISPNVTVLATSRRRLDIAAEVVHGCEPLWSGDSAAAPACSLFRDGAGRAGCRDADDLDHDAVRAVCTRLNGLPLAIELVAARVPAWSLVELQEALDAGNDFQRADVEGRHRSLYDAVDWSVRLLSSHDQVVFGRLGVWSGDFDDVAVGQIACNGDVAFARRCLHDLVEHSLVVADTCGSRTRYRLLDTIRAEARRRLTATGDLDDVRRAHLEHYREVAEMADMAVRSSGELIGHATFEQEWHNFRAAVVASCDLDLRHHGRAIVAASLWWAHTRVRVEIGEWAERLIELPSPSNGGDAVATIAAALSAAIYANDHRRTTDLRVLAEQHDEVAAEPWIPCLLMKAVEFSEGREMAQAVCRRARSAGSQFWEVVGLLQEAAWRSWAMTAGEHRDGHGVMIERAVAEAHRLANPNGLIYADFVLGNSLRHSNPARSRRLLTRSLALAEPLCLELAAHQARLALAILEIELGHPEDGLERMLDQLRMRRRTGFVDGLASDVSLCAHAFVALGRLDVAVACCQYVNDTDPDAYRLSGLARYGLAATVSGPVDRFELVDLHCALGHAGVIDQLIDLVEVDRARPRPD